MLLRGSLNDLFYGAYNGSKNLGEYLPTSALTGTITFSPASLTLTGSSTKFQDELHIGQMFTAVNDVLVVQSIQTQTSLTLGRLPTTTGTNVSGHRTRNLFALNTHRASLLWGDGSFTDRGNIIAVGDGALYLDGAVLPGDTLVALRRAKIAIYDATTNTYDVVLLGFDEVPGIVYTDITVNPMDGTKNTSLGYYSFRIAYYSDTTDGYSNPTATMLEAGLDGYQVTVPNSTFNIDFSNDVSNRPDKATGYIIYASAFAGSSDISKVNAIQGGWFELIRVTFVELAALTTPEVYSFDYIDSDLSSTLASFDNDTPPDAEFVSLFAGYVNLISTGGKGVNTTGREAATSPGPYIAPMKADNIDSYPATSTIVTEKGETIIGYINAAGRMFPMTPNTLQASTPTGLSNAQPLVGLSPFTLRPFWQRGFASPYNLMCIDDTLYGFTTKGPYRSIATGDSAEASNDFASSVDAQMSQWSPGYVMVAYDPRNSAICYFHSACSTNAEGYWETEIYPYSLKINDWMPRILLTDPTRDMVVTGVATVHNELCFVAGGRRQAMAARFDTWSFDTGDGDVDYYLAWVYRDEGTEMTPKIVRKLRPKGKFTSAMLQIFGILPGEEIDGTELEMGDSDAAEFTIALDDSTFVKQYEVIKTRCKNMLMYTVRIGGTSNGDGTLGSTDQLHEIAVLTDQAGQER